MDSLEDLIGVSWDSHRGERSVVGIVYVAGTPQLAIGTSGEPFHELLHPEELDREIAFDSSNLESRKRQREREDEIERIKREKEETPLFRFLSTMSPMGRGRAAKTLERTYQSDGALYSLHQLIEKKVQEGWIVIDAKEGLRLVDQIDNRFFFQKDITKTGMLYAAWLESEIGRG